MQEEDQVESSAPTAGPLPQRRVERAVLAASVALGAAGMANFGGRFEASVPHVVQFAVVAAAAVAQYSLYGIVLRIAPRLDRRSGPVALAASALFIVTALVVYPAVDSRPNAGNDNDDALTIGVRALQHGDDPYALRTYHGLPVAPLPGGFVLAAPAVLATSRSGATTLLALAAFVAALRVASANDPRRVRLLVLMLVATPSVWLSLANGSDELAVGLWACAGAMVVLREARLAASLLGAAAAAVAFSTRTFVVPVLAPLAALVAVTRPSRRSLAAATAFGVTTMLLFAPFADRLRAGTFPPLTVVAEHKRDAIELSAALYYAIIATGLLTAVGAAWRLWRAAANRTLDETLARWAQAAWLIIGIPFGAVVALSPTHLQSASYFNATVPLALAALVLSRQRPVTP